MAHHLIVWYIWYRDYNRNPEKKRRLNTVNHVAFFLITVKEDWDTYLEELQQHSTMKGKRRSPRCHGGVTNDNGQKSILQQQKWMTSLALTEKVLSKKSKMISICLNLCVALSTFNYTPASLIFIQFSLWSFILLTSDPLWLNWGVLIVIWPNLAELLSG